MGDAYSPDNTVFENTKTKSWISPRYQTRNCQTHRITFFDRGTIRWRSVYLTGGGNNSAIASWKWKRPCETGQPSVLFFFFSGAWRLLYDDCARDWQKSPIRAVITDPIEKNLFRLAPKISSRNPATACFSIWSACIISHQTDPAVKINDRTFVFTWRLDNTHLLRWKYLFSQISFSTNWISVDWVYLLRVWTDIYRASEKSQTAERIFRPSDTNSLFLGSCSY